MIYLNTRSAMSFLTRGSSFCASQKSALPRMSVSRSARAICSNASVAASSRRCESTKIGMLAQTAIPSLAIDPHQLRRRRFLALARPEQRALSQLLRFPGIQCALDQPATAGAFVLLHPLDDRLLQLIVLEARVECAQIREL